MVGRFWKDFQIEFEKILLRPRSRKTIKRFIALTFGLTIFISTYLLSKPLLSKTIIYQAGDISEEYIRVEKDINYELKEETKKKKEEAAGQSPVIFVRDYSVYKKVVNEINNEFNTLLSIEGNDNLYEKSVNALPFLQETKGIKADDIESALLYRDNPEKLIHWISEYATLVFDNYAILDKKESLAMAYDKSGMKVITESEIKESEVNWTPEKLIYAKDIFKYKNYSRLLDLSRKIQSAPISRGAKKIGILRALELYYSTPYVRYDEYETKKRKDAAADKIKPVYATLKKGLTIARPGDPIDQEKLFQIKILNEHQGATNFKNILGIFLIQAILSLAIGIYIYKFSDFTMRDLASYLILLSLIYVIIFVSFFVSHIAPVKNGNIYFVLFVPLIFMSVMCCILLGARITFAAGIYLTIFIYFLSSYDTGSLVISIMSVLTGIFATIRMNRRSDFFSAAIMSALIISITVLGLDLSLNKFGQNTVLTVTVSSLNAFLSIVLAIGILPIYEGVFNIPTRFRLIELSDINHPLLKKLSTEAPSSYSHSLLMASMSEKAVSAIGGDTLLTRVGCLYHDIGKLLNAGVYAENKNLDDFARVDTGYDPTAYAETIIRHVQDGIEMAREYRLPEKVISFIPEHHGTSLMRYFYHEALKENEKTKTPPDKGLFQYPGPKPQTKETAIVMIADSLEAASRTVSEPTRENYVRLIETIMSNKAEEGQLDDCNITLNEVKKIKESFLETLLSTFHLRPKYPSKKSTARLEKSYDKNNKVAQSKKPEAGAKAVKKIKKPKKPKK